MTEVKRFQDGLPLLKATDNNAGLYLQGALDISYDPLSLANGLPRI